MPETIQRKSLATQIYEDLRVRIVAGMLAPGTSLTLVGLAKDYGVSVTPVREAIRNLAGDGLVEISAHLRPVVCDWGQDQVRAVLDARLMIEQYAVAKAVARITAEELDALYVLNRRIAGLAGVREVSGLSELIELDEAFHLGLVRPAGNPVIERLYATLPRHLLPLRWAGGRSEADDVQAQRIRRHQVVNTQHVQLLDAYADRDAERAKTAVAEHIETIWRQSQEVAH